MLLSNHKRISCEFMVLSNSCPHRQSVELWESWKWSEACMFNLSLEAKLSRLAGAVLGL